MRIRWRNFELPSQVRMDRDTATPQFGRFVVEPFETLTLEIVCGV